MHQVERSILRFTDSTVVVHVTADTGVIEKRMRDDRHVHQVIGDNDVDAVKSRFSELVEWSLLGRKITIDNSGSLADTMDEFERKIEPHLTDTVLSELRARGRIASSKTS